MALWWLYFGAPAENSRAAAAPADNLLIAEPGATPHGVGLAIVLGGPALFLLGVNLFRWMTTGRVNPKGALSAAPIVGLQRAPLYTCRVESCTLARWRLPRSEST